MSMNHEERSKLLLQSRDKLKRTCKSLKISAQGSKSDMIERIIAEIYHKNKINATPQTPQQTAVKLRLKRRLQYKAPTIIIKHKHKHKKTNIKNSKKHIENIHKLKPKQAKIVVNQPSEIQKQSTPQQTTLDTKPTSQHPSTITLCFSRIDHGLSEYYQSLGRTDYFNQNGIGKFSEFIQENGFENEDVDEEFHLDLNDCCLIEFDDNFPFDDQLKHKDQQTKDEFVFKLLIQYYNGQRMHMHNEMLCNGMDCVSLKAISKFNFCSSVDENIYGIKNILKHFFHLLSQHNDDTSFEIIYNRLGGFCYYKKCKIFKRMYSISRHVSKCDVIESVVEQIMDKIHCYYRHCYDGGDRMTKQEKKRMKIIQIMNDNDENI
eukprot:62603_1